MIFALVLARAAMPQSLNAVRDNYPASRRDTGKDWLDSWLVMVSKVQAGQPHWITPLITVTPCLEQEFRFDFAREEADGQTTMFYGNGKGLELIPMPRMEVILGIPSYNSRGFPDNRSGFGDESFLVKYRVLASNQPKNSQILSFFLGASLPAGSRFFSRDHVVVTPTVAYGRGYGSFDLQTTLGVEFPAGGTATLGRELAWNSALQEHAARLLWPELEFNFSSWDGGANGGRKQLFITPGIVAGRWAIHNRLGVTAGIGFQIAATRFHSYNHALIVSFRLPF